MSSQENPAGTWFSAARFGLFIHYGLYSQLARGEWVLNRERIPLPDYRRLAEDFTAAKFDAGALCDLAVRSGMRYVVLTTMHHDGFCLYDTQLTDFNVTRFTGRDLVREFVDAARARGLRIGLYHSLNNWMAQPDGVAALESHDAYEEFIAATHARIRELVTLFNPIDTMWYDGWWPFNAQGWRADEMNTMVRAIQPHIIFNGRNGLPGDFATPEGHLTAPTPWRPWEACMTHNGSWGYHAGDHAWKTPTEIVAMLATVASSRGNLLLNLGPRGDGAPPPESVRDFERVGQWLKHHGEAIYATDDFTFGLRERGDHRGDWTPHGPFTAAGNNLYLFAQRWPGETFAVADFECEIHEVSLLGTGEAVAWRQEGGRVTLTGLPAAPPDPVCPVFRFTCDGPPRLNTTGGMRVPRAPHPPYDPCPSDIDHG